MKCEPQLRAAKRAIQISPRRSIPRKNLSWRTRIERQLSYFRRVIGGASQPIQIEMMISFAIEQRGNAAEIGTAARVGFLRVAREGDGEPWKPGGEYGTAKRKDRGIIVRHGRSQLSDALRGQAAKLYLRASARRAQV